MGDYLFLEYSAYVTRLKPDGIYQGVADETDSLREDEVFCQIHPPDGEPQVIIGRCLIYRNPCCKHFIPRGPCLPDSYKQCIRVTYASSRR